MSISGAAKRGHLLRSASGIRIGYFSDRLIGGLWQDDDSLASAFCSAKRCRPKCSVSSGPKRKVTTTRTSTVLITGSSISRTPAEFLVSYATIAVAKVAATLWER